MIKITNTFKSYLCTNCGRGSRLDVEELELAITTFGERKILNKPVDCACGNKFTLYQGMIEELVADSPIAALEAVCNVRYFDSAEITVGKEYRVTLPRKLLINKVYLTNMDAPCTVAPYFYSEFETDSFTIVSSESADATDLNYRKFGENHKVSWRVYGKDGDKPTETWLMLLTQIKEQILHGQYNIAVLTSEMMFESFLDSTLNKLLISQGLSQDAAYTIVESISSILNKAHKLLKDLNGQGLQGAGKGKNPINKEWQDLLKLRNKIAHGENVEVDKDKAQWALRTALDAIFFIYNNCEMYE